MKQSLKAALVSGLIFPGLGHMVVKRYLRGWVLLLATLLAVSVLITSITQQALTVVEGINRGEIPADITAIAEAVGRYSDASGGGVENLALIAIAACWLIGIVDSYRIGVTQER